MNKEVMNEEVMNLVLSFNGWEIKATMKSTMSGNGAEMEGSRKETNSGEMEGFSAGYDGNGDLDGVPQVYGNLQVSAVESVDNALGLISQWVTDCLRGG